MAKLRLGAFGGLRRGSEKGSRRSGEENLARLRFISRVIMFLMWLTIIVPHGFVIMDGGLAIKRQSKI